jgi:very-short-patch-repair endonuclease
MRDFAKSILNYFAAFSETRFRLNKRLPYEWTDDATTLDLCVFPEFEVELLGSVAAGKPFSLDVPPGRYVVSLEAEAVRTALTELVSAELGSDFLETQICDVQERLQESLPEEEREGIEQRALTEGLRRYNLALRQAVQQALVHLQDSRIEELRAELGFSSVPPSTFNPQREVQRLYDELTAKARGRFDAVGYVEEVLAYLEEQPFAYTIFDLHLCLRRFLEFVGTQTIHAFFHDMAADEGPRYPIFTVEVTGTDGSDAVRIATVRDVLMLNTPAINSFEFDTVLTTPRASRFEESDSHLSGIERFLQAKYSVSESFILQPHYQPLVGEKLPTVRYRVGLQAVKDEDRRILDYSELITTLDAGGGRKFTDMVSRYVGSNVENTASEVDREYRTRYPRGSAERLVPKSLSVPLQLNETQRKILTATENPRNEIIVVDGPPGTGKSYTITALVYLANQMGKSVLVTSHKRQALDVIDQALTEQFKKLHPQSKPSVMRLERGRGPAGINSIQNTLSTQAVNAARRRSEDLRKEAVETDRERTRQAVEDEFNSFWKQADICEVRQRLTYAWATELEALRTAANCESLPPPRRFPEGRTVSADAIRRLTGAVTADGPSLSLEALAALFQARDQLPEVLRKCDELNRLAAGVPRDLCERVSEVPEELRRLQEIVVRLADATETGAVLAACEIDDLSIDVPADALGAMELRHADAKAAHNLVAQLVASKGKMLSGILRRKEITSLQAQLAADHPEVAKAAGENDAAQVLDALKTRLQQVEALKQRFPCMKADYLMAGHVEHPPDALRADIAALTSLEYGPAVESLGRVTGRALVETPFTELADACDQLSSLADYMALQSDVATFAGHVGMDTSDLPRLYATLKSVGTALDAIQAQDIDALSLLFDCGQAFFAAMGIERGDLATLFHFARDADRLEHLLRLVDLHGQLSSLGEPPAPDRAKVADFFNKTQRLLQRDVDDRFSNLLNHMGDVSRLQTAIESGKRITAEQARVLLGNLSCIISEPTLISQHFPMEPDMVDLLIIDEASQVSIAESISLMLRAKQTVVFGDELQYGAVGAVNVSQRYSEHYFKDILTDFAKTQNTAISDEERDRLAREASAEPSEEDEESSRFIPVAPGTREWLKTFSVRTSTLAFAKALQNYSASLNTHFRSFPEIISYSNDVFYRPSQIELVTNRIRTKPIGEVLRFLHVTTRGMSGRNVNLDEIEAVQRDIERLVADGYKGTIGVICSFKEQAARMDEVFRKEMTIHPDLVRNHKFRIWFVGDVQGEERDLVYYSFVQDKQCDNADLKSIYPTVGGTADNIRRLKMQRLNVGFSRAKDMMVFVHSMDIGEYSDTRLGDALRHYEKILSATHDHYVEDEAVFDSPAEKRLYSLIVQTPFFVEHRDSLRLIAQFEIGQYIRQEYRRYIPNYRVDFLLTKTDGGKEKSLVIEYDGLEFHTKDPDIVTAHNFDREYLEYDIERQVELESYGYSFLRINKFSLTPTAELPTEVAVLDSLLRRAFG